MLRMRAQCLAVLFLYVCSSIAVADPRAIHLRRSDESSSHSTITEASKTQSTSSTQSKGSSSGQSGGDSTITPAPSRSGSSSVSSSSNSTLNSSSSNSTSVTPTTSVIISAITSNINGAVPTSAINTSIFNSTATPGKLPLTPEVTPGFAVAGVLLMLTGTVYTLVGIKNKWLHIYLSASYLASLAVTVLIIYVMNPPISNAIQGAYVVAVSMTGIILGGAAIVFTEMTEGLGCLLGGFCLSMWLLVLKPGGLLSSTGAKTGFIAAFTLGGFATSFSHITRPYSLIGFISFSGATVVVLGIDCVSRAGLKEFWAYIWNLNNNLFPVGVTTYPLTRGMKVEIAAIVVIFIAGVMSQMKLWKIIKERREQRAVERLEDERTMRQEEENVGRRVEEHNAEERNQWEAVYGDKDLANGLESNRDSGVADMESQKKGARSIITLRRSGEDEIEMADIPSPTLKSGAGLVLSNKGQDGGPITIRVARDLEPPPTVDEKGNQIETSQNRLSHVSANSSPNEEEAVWVLGADGEARLSKRLSQRNSLLSAKRVSIGPSVVPLPFKVPEGEEEEDGNSSVATFADDEIAIGKRKSGHLSSGSAFMRRLSGRSDRSSKRFSRGESTEDLVIPHEVDHHPATRASSLAATMDGLSDDEDTRSTRSSIVPTRDTEALRISGVDEKDRPHANLTAKSLEEATKRISAVSVGTSFLDPNRLEEQEGEKTAGYFSFKPRTDQKTTSPDAQCEETEKPPANAAPTVVSVADSKPATLTKESLPPQLSKVVMSYRTNEWAKHLSAADVPDLDELKLAEYPAETDEEKTEAAAPVNVEELQQTPKATVSPAITRSSSAISKIHPSPYFRTDGPNGESLSRSTSQLSMHGPPEATINTRSMSKQNSFSRPVISQPIVESPIEEEASASAPNLLRFASPNPYGSQSTLMGQRDTILRSKSSLYIASPSALASTPELTQQHFHSTAASQVGSDMGSVYGVMIDDENLTMSQRRELIRQNSFTQQNTLVQQPPVPFDTHQPRRQSSAPHPLAREQQLASFRASVQNDFVNAVPPRATIERQRSQLWQEKQAEEQRKMMEAKKRGARDDAFDARMRSGDMLSAHREALRRMQAKANGNA